MATRRGFQKIVLASDCLSLVQRLLAPSFDRSPVWCVVRDIKASVMEFASCSFKFYKRSLNVVARSAEPFVCNFSFSVIPEIIRDELCTDVN